MTAQLDDVGGAVRRARLERRMSLRTLADHVGLSPATLSNAERGRARLGADRVIRIAAALEVDPASLLGREVLAAELAAEEARHDLPGLGGVASGGWRDFGPITLDPVLTAALDVFVERGYHAANVRSIASAAGLSVAGVYHHYDSKHRMLVSLLDIAMAELRWRLVAAISETEEPVARFAAAVECVALYHAVRWQIAFLGFAEVRGLEPDDRARITALRDEVQHIVDEQAAAVIAAGLSQVSEPRVATRAVVTMCTALPSWFRQGQRLSAEDVARHYASYAVAMLGAGAPT